MTLRQIIEQLRKEGHHVEYIENKPPKSKKTGKRSTKGQIRITKIDGVKYAPNKSLGNIRARELKGESLSTKQVQQMREARAKATQKIRSKNPLPTDIEKDIRRIQRKIRASEKKKAKEQGKTEIEKSKSTLRLKTKSVREKLKKDGYEATKRSLRNIERYWEGYANDSSIQALKEMLRQLIMHVKSTYDRKKLEECLNILDDIEERLGEYALEDILMALYDYQNGRIKVNDLLRLFENKAKQKGRIKGAKDFI